MSRPPLPPVDVQLTIPLPPKRLLMDFAISFRKWGDYFGAVKTDIGRTENQFQVCWWFDDFDNAMRLTKCLQDMGVPLTEAGPREVVN